MTDRPHYFTAGEFLEIVSEPAPIIYIGSRSQLYIAEYVCAARWFTGGPWLMLLGRERDIEFDPDEAVAAILLDKMPQGSSVVTFPEARLSVERYPEFFCALIEPAHIESFPFHFSEEFEAVFNRLPRAPIEECRAASWRARRQ